MSGIEAVYIFDEHNNLLLSHPFSLRPPPPHVLLNHYLSTPTPRPSLLHCPNTNPPSILHTHQSDALLLLSPTTTDVPPLLVLEFLHRITDSLREFLGSPLLASRLESSYDLAVQILTELCDAGLISNTEPNALRDVVEAPSAVTRLLGGATPSLSQGSGGAGLGTGARMQGIGPGDLRGGMQTQAAQQSAIPWRRSNVRHTSNELYVDLVESVQATFAPSGRALEAMVHGAVAFNCKVSGVPDLLLVLRTDAGSGGLDRGERVRRVVQRPVFHPCVRLARWKSHGELSFVPPDGRFVLAGYETDLLEGEEVLKGAKVNLPADLEVRTGLGDKGDEFEVRLIMNSRWAGSSGRTSPSVSAGSSQQSLSNSMLRAGPRSAVGSLGSLSSNQEGKGPTMEDLKVFVPLPATARKIPEIRASRGEAHFSPAESGVTWIIPGRVASQMSSAVLRCTVVGEERDGFADGDAVLGSNGIKTTTYDYDEGDAAGYQSEEPVGAPDTKVKDEKAEEQKRKAASEALMPRSVNLSFSVKGWLASGLKVDSLTIDTKRSRGLGEG
ncbi:putative AP-3 complex subunit mu [Elsinoe australis]|uniref:Putative AP-3 complex subunit mu n=1 Tax=Elsinoe australis TaxID=40998 RepID=A0A4U7BF55_9PEZI|nr:putative AP-3 complex subunit mu [Elsinoe australis]